MKFAILIEPISDQRFRATGPLAGLTAEGETAEEARRRLAELLQERVSAGLQWAWLETEVEPKSAENPLASFAGIWRDEPLMDEYDAEVARHRRERDCDNLPSDE